MNVCKVDLSCFDFAVYLSTNAIMHDYSTLSLITSQHNAISFSNTKSTSSYKLYGTYTTKF